MRGHDAATSLLACFLHLQQQLDSRHKGTRFVTQVCGRVHLLLAGINIFGGLASTQGCYSVAQGSCHSCPGRRVCLCSSVFL